MRKLLVVLMVLFSAGVLSSCSLLPFGNVFADDYQLADDRMEQIADAVNSHDAAALKSLFSDRALERATDIDAGLEYFLSFFPNGGLTWKRDSLNGEGEIDQGKRTWMLSVQYTVSADGKDYSLAFNDFVVNGLTDPENVGLYNLGVAPAEDTDSLAAELLICWVSSTHYDHDSKYGYPGIYIPDPDMVCKGQQGDARMEQIAAAVNSQDAAALKGMFSTRALEQATGLDEEVDRFLSVFPDGGLTWERPGVNSVGDEAGEETQLLTVQVKVSAGGKDYWLFFADYAVNTIDPDSVGLAALAVTPWAEPGSPDLDADFTSWNSSWIQHSEGPYGIYVPTG